MKKMIDPNGWVEKFGEVFSIQSSDRGIGEREIFLLRKRNGELKRKKREAVGKALVELLFNLIFFNLEMEIIGRNGWMKTQFWGKL